MKTKPLPPVKVKPGHEKEHAEISRKITEAASATLPNWSALKELVDRRNELIEL